MESFENQVMIRCDHIDIYNYLLDLENLPFWNYAILNVENQSNGFKETGAEYKLERKIFGKHVKERVVLKDFKPNEKIIIESFSNVFPAIMEYHIFQNNEGITVVKNKATLLSEGLFKYFGKFLVNSIKQAVEQNLFVLKRIMENKNKNSV
jgi:hypothetical protein